MLNFMQVDIFAYDLILFPIHLEAHWCLVAVDLRGRDILYFDSLRGLFFRFKEIFLSLYNK